MNQVNPEQHEAIEHHAGPLLVLAGAGSGKTLVVTRRIARLIERGVSPHAILAMTFTNKAAEEMLERVVRLVGKGAKGLTVSTFHAFGLQVLREETKALGFADGKFAIFDQADQASTVREIFRSIRTDRRYDVWAILTRISKAKNEFVTPEAYQSRQGDEYDEVTAFVYPRYVAALKAFRAFDFDDLVCEVVRLFQRRADVVARWRQRFWYLLVDEYQDTNHAQFELVRLLAEETQNVCAVGDDDQSIYAWRGADVKNILDYERHFPGAQIVKLLRNYRSTDAILAVANAVIRSSGGRRHDKQLSATRQGGQKVQLVVAHDPDIEAAFVADEAQALMTRDGLRPRDIAILYRSNTQSEVLETALRQREIPFRVVGGTQFYERKEVKDIIAYLRVALHSRDEISLRRIINYPARGIGDTALEHLSTYAMARDWTLWRALESARDVPGLTSQAIGGCDALTSVIFDAQRNIAERKGAGVVARAIADAVGLEADINVGSGTNAVATRRRENLQSFFRVLERFDAAPRAGQSLDGLLHMFSLKADDNSEEPGNVLTLTTMHGAKGLEFKTVFIVGTEEGLIPHARTLDVRATDAVAQDIEEERRLFYVAVTRAMDVLYICRAKHRMSRGRATPRTPSRFLADIPEDLVETREVRDVAAPPTHVMLDSVEALLAALDQK